MNAILLAVSRTVKKDLEEQMRIGNQDLKDEVVREIHRGWEAAEEKGREEGREEGLCRGKAEALLVILEARGMRLTDAQRITVLQCTDLATLDRWLGLALTVRSANDLFH